MKEMTEGQSRLDPGRRAWTWSFRSPVRAAVLTEKVAKPSPSVVRFCSRRADQISPSNRYTAVLATGVPLR